MINPLPTPSPLSTIETIFDKLLVKIRAFIIQ